MRRLSNKYFELFISLTRAIQAFLQEIKGQKLQNMATKEWTVKDELSHIAFWHNYYAQNYESLANGTEPFVFRSKGGSTRNQDGVNSINKKSQKDLINIINNAQKSLYKSIVIKKVPKMTYIENSEYKTEDFLVMITRHIQRHTIQVRQAK